MKDYDHYQDCRRTDRDIFLNHWGLILIHILAKEEMTTAMRDAHLLVNKRIYKNWISWSTTVGLLPEQQWGKEYDLLIKSINKLKSEKKK